MDNNKLYGWFKWSHLNDAQDLSKDGKRSIFIVSYIMHMWVGVKEFAILGLLSIASLIHGIIPPLFHFKLLEILVNRTIGMYKFLPNHPIWDKLKEELNKEK